MILALVLSCSSTPNPESEPVPALEPAEPIEEVGKNCYAAAKETPLPQGLVSVGSFTQIRATEDHAYGHGFDLMRNGDTCVGLYSLWEGNIEAHFAVIEDLSCPDADGKLSFRVGRMWWPGYGDVGPFKSAIRFDGTVNGDAITGTVTQGDEKTPFEAKGEDVSLEVRWGQYTQLSAADACVGDRVR